MRAKLKRLTANILLSLASLAIGCLVLEFAVFRTLLKPDDVLPNVSIDGVVRYEPNTLAVFRHPGGYTSRVSINAQGWNASRSDYRIERKPGVKRIAVIGDSYVHGAFVDTEQGFPEVLERELAARGQPVEVYRFGMDGAPLSQYLHMLRHEVLRYRPDLVVVQLIHNDFDESYRLLSTRYASSFLKIDLNDQRPVEVVPVDFRSGMADMLRRSAMFRYLYYETDAYLRLKGLINRVYWGGEEDYRPEHISSGVDVRNIADHVRNERAARYVFDQMEVLARQSGFKLLLSMDGVRDAIYAGRPAHEFPVGRLNEIAKRTARDLGLPIVDLHDIFQRDYSAFGYRHEFSFDWHWNARANALVGRSLADAIMSAPELLQSARGPFAATRSGQSLPETTRR